MADEVVRRQLDVINPLGIHVRPASLIVQLANRFQSEIDLVKDGHRVDAKSMLQLMTFAANQGARLSLEVRGVDAAAAADAIEKLFQEGLGDFDAPPPAN